VTLGRLTALLGPDRVGAPQTVEGHRPERYSVAEFLPPPPPELPEPEATRALLTVRVLRPPVALEVIVEAERPAAVRSLQTNDRRRPEIQGAVTVASGPWRLEEGWWTGAGVARAYWDVELAGGGLYRIYQDHAADWFADGIYD
jgi:protein ImuB